MSQRPSMSVVGNAIRKVISRVNVVVGGGVVAVLLCWVGGSGRWSSEGGRVMLADGLRWLAGLFHASGSKAALQKRNKAAAARGSFHESFTPAHSFTLHGPNISRPLLTALTNKDDIRMLLLINTHTTPLNARTTPITTQLKRTNTRTCFMALEACPKPTLL